MIHVLILIAVLTTLAKAVLSNAVNSSNGFCDEDSVSLTIATGCVIERIYVSIDNDTTNFSNLLLQCNNTNCYESSLTYNLTNRSLNLTFKFKHRQHAAKFLNIRITCQNQTQIKDHVFLKPCISGFTSNVTHHGENVIIFCQHSSFNQTVNGMRIGNEDNEFLHCSPKNCYKGKRLPNGASVEVAYQPGMILLCKMDGAVLNLTKTIEATTIPVSPTTSTTQSTPTPSHLVTRENVPVNNSASYTATTSLLMCFAAYCISFIPP